MRHFSLKYNRENVEELKTQRLVRTTPNDIKNNIKTEFLTTKM